MKTIERESTRRVLHGDIYDGRIWHDFQTSNFLSSPMSYLMTLNVDWFQPFLHTQYSVGAMYLTIQNLPRDIRCKEENVILVGVLPGPSEPKLVMNSYLSPLVEELKQGWKGFSVLTSEGVQVNIRVALSCIACDIPATRKVCGFIGHHASLACNKCFQSSLQARLITLGMTVQLGHCAHVVCIADIVRRYQKKKQKPL